MAFAHARDVAVPEAIISTHIRFEAIIPTQFGFSVVIIKWGSEMHLGREGGAPVRHVLVGVSVGDVEHDDGALATDAEG